MAMLIRSKKVIKYREEENKGPLVEFEFTCDSTSDLPTSPMASGEEIAQGSRCWVIESAIWYGYTSTGKWINQKDGGAAPVLIEKTITENGTYDASADNADGYKKVTVDVSGGGGGETFEVILDTSDGVTFTPNKTFAETVAAMQNQTPVTMKMRFEDGGQTIEQLASFFYNAIEFESINTIYVPFYFTNSSMNGYIWNENGFGASTFHSSILINTNQ